MRRKLPTGKLTTLDAAASIEPVRLIVEYEGADDFLVDWAESLSRGRGVVQTSRVLDPGSPLELGISFPGLVEPLVVDALVRAAGDGTNTQAQWVEVELLDTAGRL